MTNSENASHQQLQQVVSERLRTEILDGQFEPGQWMRQKKIADELGVSQMPVREALKELAAEGLVEHIPYRGVRVIEFTREDITDIYAQRACLESRAAKMVAQIISDQQIRNLKEIQDQLEASNEPKRIQSYRRLNRDFHQTIYQLSGRGYLIRTLDQMWSSFPTMLIGNFPLTSQMPIIARKRTDVDEHRLIIEAFEHHDPEAAGTAMQNHIQSVCRDFLSTLSTEMS